MAELDGVLDRTKVRTGCGLGGAVRGIFRGGGVMKVVRFIGWCYDNGRHYRSYRVFGRYLIHVGGKFPWVHGDLGWPF